MLVSRTETPFADLGQSYTSRWLRSVRCEHESYIVNVQHKARATFRSLIFRDFASLILHHAEVLRARYAVLDAHLARSLGATVVTTAACLVLGYDRHPRNGGLELLRP